MCVCFEDLCKAGLALPGVERGTSYGTPALKLRGKLLMRLKEDGKTAVLRCDWEDRERLLEWEPQVFHLTDHYLKSPYVLVHISAMHAETVEMHMLRAWRCLAGKKLQLEFDAG